MEGGTSMYIQQLTGNPADYGLWVGNSKQSEKLQGIQSMKDADSTQSVDKGDELRKQYLELAVGVREKELERLGLGEDEDGTVFLKTGEDEDKQAISECETCANRKYQDGSDEMVSFKSAQHISPDAAATRVRAHEQEHVSNAYKKAEQEDAEVVRASVAIHTSVCPECGRTYVSGGTTTTSIRYNQDAYAGNAKKQDATVVPGANVDAVS